MTVDIQKDVNLAPYTTFHIGGPARFFCAVSTMEDLSDAVAWARGQQVPILILGGGSNMLVSDKGFSGLVIHFINKGITTGDQTDSAIQLNIASGEVWDNVVAYAVNNAWWGIENLSHIPGLAGGFAVQNVGAYGQEASQVVVSVEAFDMLDQQLKTFTKQACLFGYRKSIFNTEEKGRYVIITTTLRLAKNGKPNLSYGAVSRYFTERSINEPSQQQIREAITEIRDTQFPFPDGTGLNANAGSFFRGPILDQLHIEYLFQKLADNFGAEAVARLHAMSDRLMVEQGLKTPSAFLIELCGLKGFTVGGAKVHDQHGAIVINAEGKATAQDVVNLFHHVGKTVYDKTGVLLHIEPELVGFTEAEKEDILESIAE